MRWPRVRELYVLLRAHLVFVVGIECVVLCVMHMIEIVMIWLQHFLFSRRVNRIRYAVELADVEGFATDGARWAVLHRRVVEHVTLFLGCFVVVVCLFRRFSYVFVGFVVLLLLAIQNIRVIAKYYERVHMTRVAQLLDLDLDVLSTARRCHYVSCSHSFTFAQNTEKYVSELVTGKSIYARSTFFAFGDSLSSFAIHLSPFGAQSIDQATL